VRRQSDVRRWRSLEVAEDAGMRAVLVHAIDERRRSFTGASASRRQRCSHGTTVWFEAGWA
jgi:hypothetical protein